MLAADDAYTAYRVGRSVNAGISLFLLALAVALLWDPRVGILSLVGLAVAVTPTAIFVIGMLNPNGPEIAAGVCFAASLVRLSRGGTVPNWIWVAFGLGGSVLGLSRSLGPVFVIFLVGAAVLLVRPGSWMSILRRGGRWAKGAGVAIALAVATNIYWQAAYQVRPDSTLGTLIDEVGPSISRVPAALEEAVGYFSVGYSIPVFGLAAWIALFVALLAAAFLIGSRRQRAGLLLLVVASLLLTIVLTDLHRQTGSPRFHGRYVLPFLGLIPLYACEVVMSNRERIPTRPRRLLGPAAAAIVLLAGMIQALAWWATARRVGVGTDGPILLSAPSWGPPGGWLPWLALVVAVPLLYLTAGLAGSRERPTVIGDRPRPD